MTLEKLKEVYKKKGYSYDDNENVVNLFGIRSTNSQSDKFDDIVGFFVKYQGEDKFFQFKATTDPGKNWLLTPMRKEGTAILVPGQYKDFVKVGRHKTYEALEQIGKGRYVRDNNKDSILDFSLYRDPIKLAALSFWENIKSNIHRASEWKIVNLVGLYSAACQVIQDPKDFQTLLRYCKNQLTHGWANQFDYTLFEEQDFK